jgi:hypothetical protein
MQVALLNTESQDLSPEQTCHQSMSSFGEQDANYANWEREVAFEYPLDPDLFNLDVFDEFTHQSPSSAKQSSMGCLGGFKSFKVESANGMSKGLEG